MDEALINKIETWFSRRKLDALQFLQGETSLVSDNATSLNEVATCDLINVLRVIELGGMERIVKSVKQEQGELKL